MRRYLLALLALLVVMGLSLWGIVSTSPQASAATTKAATIYPQDEIRSACWNPVHQAGWGWSQVGQIFNEETGGSCYNFGGEFRFVLSPCAAPPNQGYCSLTEVYLDIAGIWQNTGKCGGFSYALDRIVSQTCNGADYQYWAGVVQSDGSHLIWSRWLQDNYPHVCPIAGGYTQQVVTSNSANGAVYMSCPQGAGGESYTAAQSWYLVEPII